MSANRPLRTEEAELIATMVRGNPNANEIIASLSRCRVEDMRDGGMGSLLFVSRDKRTRIFGKKIAEAEFNDEDGVLVSATVNVDEGGALFELDIWKVDFSPLKRYPRPDEVRAIPV